MKKERKIKIDPVRLNGTSLSYLIEHRMYLYISLIVVELIFSIIGVAFGFLFGDVCTGGIFGFLIGLLIGIIVGIRVKKEMK